MSAAADVAGAGAGRIGPNAIIQTAAALRARVGDPRAGVLVADATGRALDEMPTGMVAEGEVIGLVHCLHDQLDPALFEAVLRDAGRRTAEYLMAHRIPLAAQWLMRGMPAPLAVRLLLSGIMRHTWTFAGSAEVSLLSPQGEALRLRMVHCPMCRGLAEQVPSCHFYAGTLETLLRRLVTPRASVVEVQCEAAGGSACEFELRIGGRASQSRRR